MYETSLYENGDPHGGRQPVLDFREVTPCRLVGSYQQLETTLIFSVTTRNNDIDTCETNLMDQNY